MSSAVSKISTRQANQTLQTNKELKFLGFSIENTLSWVIFYFFSIFSILCQNTSSFWNRTNTVREINCVSRDG